MKLLKKGDKAYIKIRFFLGETALINHVPQALNLQTIITAAFIDAEQKRVHLIDKVHG